MARAGLSGTDLELSTGPGGGGGSFRRILVPVDGSAMSGAAVAAAAQLSVAMGGQVRVVHVRIYDPPARCCGRFYPETSQGALAVIDDAVSRAWACGAKASGIVVEERRSRAAAAICASAWSWQADLIVLARRRRLMVTRLLLGSVSYAVLAHAACPVLVVRVGRA